MSAWTPKDKAATSNQLENIFFVDIETASQNYPDGWPNTIYKRPYDSYCDRFKNGIKNILENDDNPSGRVVDDYNLAAIKHYEQNASLYAEHGKIVNISIGKFQVAASGKLYFYVKSIYGDGEIQILSEANEAISKANILCAHNGKEFDYPFWFRRCVIHGLAIPPILNTIGKKPWDVNDQLFDTMTMWSGTAWNYRVSLSLLCEIFKIESPKGEIDGSKISGMTWCDEEHKEENFKKIGKYGAGDVVALANVYCKMKRLPLIASNQVIYTNEISQPKPNEDNA